MVTKQQSSIFVTLQSIQQSLVAPKGQYNSFGKYSYRSAEDILEALKPILQEHDAVLILQDGIVQIGDRYYVEATATLYAVGETIQNSQAGRTSQKPAQKTNSKQEQSANAPAKSNGAKTITGAQAKAIRTELKNMAEATGSPAATIGKWFIDKMGVDKPESIPADRLKEAQKIIADAKKARGIE